MRVLDCHLHFNGRVRFVAVHLEVGEAQTIDGPAEVINVS